MEKQINTRRNFLLPILAFSLAFLVFGGGSIWYAESERATNAKNRLVSLVQSDSAYLDAAKVLGANTEAGIYATAQTAEGDYVFLKVVDGHMDRGQMIGSTLLTLPNGQLATHEGDAYIPLIILKDGTQTSGQIVDRLVTFFQLKDGSTISVLLRDAIVRKGSLEGLFGGRSIETGYAIAGDIVSGRIHEGYISTAPSFVPQVTQVLAAILKEEVLLTLGTPNVLAAESDPRQDRSPSVGSVLGATAVKDRATGTYKLTGVTESTLSIATISEVLKKQVSQQLSSQIIQVIAEQPAGALALNVVGSGVITTAEQITDGIVGSDEIADESVLSGDIKNGTIKSEDLAAGVLASSDVTGVSAGAGLTGGGSSGDLALAIGGGNGISVSDDAIAVAVSTSGGVGSTSANSGLEVSTAGVSLLKGCTDGQVLGWDDASALWKCTDPATGGGSGDITEVTAGPGLSGGGATGAVTLTVSGLTVTHFTSAAISQWTNDSGYITASSTDTLTNKTIAAGSNTISGLTNSNFSGAAGITNANLANSSVTINSAGILSGGGSVALGGTLTLTATEADTLAAVVARGASANDTVHLNGGINTTSGGLTLDSAGSLVKVKDNALFEGAATVSGTLALGSDVLGDFTGTGLTLSGGALTVSGLTAAQLAAGNFSSAITSGTYSIDVSGNAATVTNGVYTGDAGSVFLAPNGNGSSLTGLTKSQVGLGNVENTALSTWAGTSNIITVGTLTGGGTGVGFTLNFTDSTLTGDITSANISGVDISADTNLSASDGITLTGDALTNSDKGSSQNIFKTVSVSGQSDVVTDSNTDALTFAAGSNVTITTTAGTDTITIAATDTNTTYSAGNDLDLTGTTFDLESTLDSVATINLAGTGTINGLDAIDATSETTLESTLDIAGDVTGTGLGSVTLASNTVDDAELVDSLSYTGALTLSNALIANGGVNTTSGALVLDSAGALIKLKDNLQAEGAATISGALAVGGVSTLTGAVTASTSVDTPIVNLTGTGTLNGLDAVDATTESTIESIIDTLANLTSAPSLVTVGTLTGGATGTGFTIDFGSSTLTGNITSANISGVDISADTNLSASDGITLTGDALTNSDKGSSQNIFKTVSVAGQSDVVTDANGDALTFVAGSNVTITTDATGDSITIVATDTNTTYTAGNDLDLSGGAFDIESTLDSVSTINLAGTGTINGLDEIDATSETTLEAAIDIAGDVTGTGLGSVTLASNTVDDAELVDSLSYTGALTLSNALIANGGINTSSGGLTLDSAGALIKLKDNLQAEGAATVSGTLAVGGVSTLTGAVTASTSVDTPILNLTGTGTLNGLDAVDATTESTIESIIDTLANLTSASSLVTVGTLTGGATGTGFTVSFTDSTLVGNVTSANISGVDISADTNLTATTGIALTGDELTATLGTSIATGEIDNDTIALTAVADTLTLDAASLTLASSDATNDYKIVFDNSSTGDIATLVQIGTSGSGSTIGVAIDASDADIATALALGSNDVTVGGATISSTEFALLDSGVTLGELTDSGTLTAGTVDINGGAMDGTTLGANSASSAIVTTLEATGNVDMNDAGADTITIGDANDQVALAGDDWSITADGALTVASCTGCGGGGGSLDTAYNSGGTITVDAYDVLLDLNDATNDYGIVIDNNTAGAIAVGLEFTSGGGGALTTAIDASASEIGTAIAIGSNDVTVGGATISSTEFARLDGKDAAIVDTNDTGTIAITGTGTLTAGATSTGFTLSFTDSTLVGNVTSANISGVDISADTNLSATDGITLTGDQLTLASATAGDGLTYTTGVLAVGAGTGISVAADAISATLGTSIATGEIDNDTIALTAVADTLTLDAATLTLASSDSTNDYKIVFDNSSTGDIATLVQIGTSGSGSTIGVAVDVSDADIATALALGSNDTTVGGATITSAEFALIDSGIALSELTDSGTFTATTVDINGGAIDGVTIGGSSAGAATVTTATVNTSLTMASDTIDEFVGTGLQLASGDLQAVLGTAIDTAEITNATIDADDLDQATEDDAPADGDCLKFETSGGGDFLWGACAAGGGVATIEENNASVTTSATTIDFLGADFIVSGASGESDVSIDYANSGITRVGQNETITGDWAFTQAGAEALDISSDLATAGTLSVLSVTGTPSGTNGTIRGLAIINASSANANGLDTGILIDNADDSVAVGTGLSITSSGGGAITTAIDLSATAIGTGISLGANDMTGTTAVINFTNFDVDASGNTDVGGTLTAGSGNEVLTLSTGKIDADAITLAAAGTTGSTSSRSGLQTSSDGLSMLMGCTDGQILEWTDASGWACADDSTGGGGGVMELLAEDTLESAANNITLTVAAREFMNCYLTTKGNTATAVTWLRFNSDSGNNYDYQLNYNIATAFVETQGLAQAQIVLDTTDTETSHHQVQISNFSDQMKNVWQRANRADNTTGPDNFFGSGTWRNTSAQITTVAFLTSTSTFIAGSHAWCEGRNVADYAENYYSTDRGIEPGDVVTHDPSLPAGIKKASTPYDPKLIGSISTEPGIVLDEGIGFGHGWQYPVALSGRIPVKVNTQNGSIRPGDLLTSSAEPGVAMRATKAGAVIGQAMEGFDGEGVGKVLTFVKTTYYNGTSSLDLLSGEGEIVNTDATTQTSARILDHIVNEQMAYVDGGALSEVMTDRVVAGLEVITPHVLAQDITTETLTAGSIVADEIIAKRIRADQIEGLDIMAGRISTVAALYDKLESVVATGSGSVAGVASESAQSSSNVQGETLQTPGEFTLATAFKNIVTFFGNVIFHGDITFFGRPTFNRDTAGYATVKEGAKEVVVQFAREYAVKPIVQANMMLVDGDAATEEARAKQLLDSGIAHVVTRVTTKGFVIRMNKTVDRDVMFTWTALAIAGATNSVSTQSAPVLPDSTVQPVASTPTPSVALSPVESVMVEATSAPTPIPSPTSTPSPTSEVAGQTVMVLPNELGYVRLREQPTTDSIDLVHIPVDAVVSYAEFAGGWYQVTFEGMTGWVSETFVSVNQ